MTSCRSWAALITLWTGLALAGASAAEHPAPGAGPPDAGASTPLRDAGVRLSALSRDGGGVAAPLSVEDVEVLLNLELLEHLPESDVLDLLLPVRDE